MVAELKNVIGKKATLKEGGMYIDVEILDVKYVYGRYVYQVMPIAGSGLAWKDIEKIRIRTKGE